MSYDILYWAASLFKSGYGKMDRYSTRDSRGRDRRQQSLVSRQVLYCLWSYSKHGLFMACDVNKLLQFTASRESITCHYRRGTCVKSMHRSLGLPTDISVETLYWCPNVGPSTFLTDDLQPNLSYSYIHQLQKHLL